MADTDNSDLVEIVVDQHSNILLIGKAATYYSYKEITYEDDYDEVLKNYGDCNLTTAFKEADDAGVAAIFMLNIHDNFDIFDCINEITQNDFTYIVPVDMMLSDYFYDTYNNNKKTYYADYLLQQFTKYNESVFVFTDKHASLYEDQDAFLKDMNNISRTIESSLSLTVDREDLIFVANNLLQHQMANVTLAIALVTTDLAEYPTTDFGPPIFLIDQYDETYNFAYFKEHTEEATTVENLLNFHSVSPEKIVTIQRIIKVIKRELDLNEFVGRLYSEYQRLQIYKRIETYLRKLVDYVLYKYDILSVTPYRDSDNPGTVIVISYIEIWPKNCLEKISLQIGVEVG